MREERLKGIPVLLIALGKTNGGNEQNRGGHAGPPLHIPRLHGRDFPYPGKLKFCGFSCVETNDPNSLRKIALHPLLDVEAPKL